MAVSLYRTGDEGEQQGLLLVVESGQGRSPSRTTPGTLGLPLSP